MNSNLQSTIKNRKFVSGQAMVGVLAVAAISIAIMSYLVINSAIVAQSSFNLRQSASVYYAAESSLANAILRLERDPNYMGEILTLPVGQVIIEITGENPKTVSAKSLDNQNKILRRLQAEVNFDSNGAVTANNWQEIVN